jgi:hypothetical protein
LGYDPRLIIRDESIEIPVKYTSPVQSSLTVLKSCLETCLGKCRDKITRQNLLDKIRQKTPLKCILDYTLETTYLQIILSSDSYALIGMSIYEN